MRKKVIAIVMILVMVLVMGIVFTSCTPGKSTTSKPADEKTEESISVETQLLAELLSKEEYLSLADDEYKSVTEFIKNETPDESNGIKDSWNLDDQHKLVLTDSRVLKLVKEDDWAKILCENVDFPNSHPVTTTDFKIVDTYTYYVCYDSIEVWKLGEELFEVQLPNTDIEFITSITNEESTTVVVRSDTTIGKIVCEDGKYQYVVLTEDAAGPIQNMLGSVWFVDKDSNLVHLNVHSKQQDIIANNVISLVKPHGGIYTVGWREKGSLEWHEPEYLISGQGEKINWSEYGGM